MYRSTITRAEKIRKRPDYLRLSRDGDRLYNRLFIAVHHKSLYVEVSRLGITVTKKVGCAVTRNRIKRLIREYFRLNKHKISGNWDINIIAKKEAAKANSAKIFDSLQELFGKIRN